jgi:extradiol dioxygenase family protein
MIAMARRGLPRVRGWESSSHSRVRGVSFEVNAEPAPGNPFHLAVPVHNMDAARAFYGDIMGLVEGRRSGDKWQDYSLFGHQLVCHYVGDDYRASDYYNPVDGDEVPVAHFGAVISKAEFDKLADNLKANDIKFIISPTLRFKGAPGEQYTMFFKDPSNNNLEFKHVTNPQYLFARYDVVE